MHHAKYRVCVTTRLGCTSSAVRSSTRSNFVISATATVVSCKSPGWLKVTRHQIRTASRRRQRKTRTGAVRTSTCSDLPYSYSY
eukprot:scaffold61115_cov35-Prasinocladus_malaysianus.AAC.2